MEFLTRTKAYLLGAEEQRAAVYDRQLLLLAIILMMVGLVMVASASLPEGIALGDDPFMFVKKHLVFLSVSLCAAICVLNVPIVFYERNSVRFLFVAIALLIVVLVIGRTVNGSTRWLSLGPLNMQPAEFAKFSLFIYFSGYLVRQKSLLQESYKGFVNGLLVIAVISTLLLFQPDFGSVMVILTTSVALLFIGGAKLVHFMALCVVAILLGVLAVILSPYRMRRITSFLDPWDDPFGSGYQLTQSLMAFGRGSFSGEGLGNSIQKLEYLPEAHTDFVFAILAEELGFVGVFIVLMLQMLLVFKALQIGRRSLETDQFFAGFLAISIGVWFCFQTLVNVGAASGLLPTKGLTLPLVSYGGSSLLIMSCAVAVLLRIDYEYRAQKVSMSNSTTPS
ncbi:MULTISPECIES: cell division protein FtsW [unclassified Moritella]|uniref:cell division protein FtsW n=1 Tax=unclassified Moritella TaxID=2637987 RepID=UPI001BAE5333|nr:MULTISPECIES: cell division protein FtsW [unclassified Moritella]QUM83257.1 cell division protein FtsW [Moritella sp. 28]QUM87559.1 cell division protein FtsW [Moritella sp. 36]